MTVPYKGKTVRTRILNMLYVNKSPGMSTEQNIFVLIMEKEFIDLIELSIIK